MQPNAKTRILAWLPCALARPALSAALGRTKSSALLARATVLVKEAKTVGASLSTSLVFTVILLVLLVWRESKVEYLAHNLVWTVVLSMGERESGEAAGGPPRREMAGAMGEGKGKPTRREQKAAEELETQTNRLKVLHAAVANACCFRIPPSHPQTAWLYLTQCPCPPGYGPATSGVSLPALHEVRASVYVVCRPGCLSELCS